MVITDIKMPDMDGIDAAAQIYRDAAVPVILVSAHHDPATVRRADAEYVMAYLVKPIKQADLEPAIAIALRRFGQFQALRKEAADLKQALEDRKLVERAKGAVMRRMRLDEQDAFRRPRKLASDPTGTMTPRVLRTRSCGRSSGWSRNGASACTRTCQVRPNRLKSLTYCEPV